ncbi:hypothetical protein SO802_015030 [Lithocarpus litseifolius]|uniref:Uncharacterized protein n=1 Tax=Lithocarpus litseifolius TaxID=425828 RepID=A0AAW2CTW0_9ROSI
MGRSLKSKSLHSRPINKLPRENVRSVGFISGDITTTHHSTLLFAKRRSETCSHLILSCLFALIRIFTHSSIIENLPHIIKQLMKTNLKLPGNWLCSLHRYL